LGASFTWPLRNGSYSVNTYNPETHELRPKKEYIDKEIEKCDESLQELKTYY
jgi:hypothetical protein